MPVSVATLRRLPQYLRILKKKKDEPGWKPQTS